MTEVDRIVSIVRGLCLRFEGLYLHAYLCPAGIPTIGVGSTRYEDGTPVTLNDPPISKDRALVMLDLHVRNRLVPAVMKLCPGADTSERIAALVDFAYNLGEGRLQASTLRRRVNERDFDGAVTELGKWTRGGGRVLPGLVRRRAAEAALLT